MLQEQLNQRKLPPLRSREEMLDLLQREEYGYLPSLPDTLTWENSTVLSNFCAGKATLQKLSLTVTVKANTFTFPVYAAIPTANGPHPFFLHINFRDDIPDRYMPSEELIDHGFAVLSFCYKDVTSDDGDFSNGLAALFYPDGKRGATDAGKIALWAWAAQRVMDYAVTDSRLDTSCAIVCGHSRLGKTALFAAATDERFAFAHSNNSGCSGASLARGKCSGGERIADICRNFPYWFCENYLRYVDREDALPFDQHALLACLAPRYVSVASAAGDIWADPTGEFLCCVAASEAYRAYGLDGFICEDRLPTIGDAYHKGHIGYHLRAGTHYFSREDWLQLIAFIRTHTN
ncbi:MAG: hypothetical protein IJW40_08905 [Clostridia bacterium]|nr:hypothetical protein [Clostridia bacterium]